MTGHSPYLAGALLLAAASATSATSAEADHAWKTFANDRFGFSICYPSDLLHEMEAPARDDGRIFASTDGVKMLIYAAHGTKDTTLVDSAQADKMRLADRTTLITYQIRERNYYVLAGLRAGQIFYNRTVRKNDTFTVLEVTYPKQNTGLWRPLVERIRGCLKPGA